MPIPDDGAKLAFHAALDASALLHRALRFVRNRDDEKYLVVRWETCHVLIHAQALVLKELDEMLSAHGDPL